MKETPAGTIPFVILSVLGALYLLVEAGLQVFGRSICVSGGCGLVAQLARFGDLAMILIGFMALAFLAVIVRFEPEETERAARLRHQPRPHRGPGRRGIFRRLPGILASGDLPALLKRIRYLCFPWPPAAVGGLERGGGGLRRLRGGPLFCRARPPAPRHGASIR